MNAHFLWHFATVFLFRHWFIAFLNAGLTALLGLGLLKLAKRIGWPRLSALSLLRLLRLVVLTAILKAAFYLLRGTAARNSQHLPLALGVQFPNPWQWIGLAPMSSLNVWQPTAVTTWISILLISMGGVFLGWRFWQLITSQHRLYALRMLKSSSQDPRLDALLLKAAHSMGIAPRAKLPQIILVELDYPTPLLLGLRRPFLLLTPQLVIMLSDLELEMALRHELAHCLRRDQWTRWLQTWLEDVGRLCGLSRILGTHALALEEEICDRMAIRTAAEALALGQAITKARQVSPSPSSAGGANAIRLPEQVLPSLLGWRTRTWTEKSVIAMRLKALVTYATELSLSRVNLPQKSAAIPYGQSNIFHKIMFWMMQILSSLVLGLFFLLILYAKFQALVGRF